MKLSEKLLQLRNEHGTSQFELAERLHVSRQTISRWETGQSSPSAENLQFLAEFYGITIDELFYSVEEKPKVQEQESQTQATEDKRKRKLFWLCAAAVVVVLLVGVLIAANDHKVHNEDVKEPVSMDAIQGVVIDSEEIIEEEIELESVE